MQKCKFPMRYLRVTQGYGRNDDASVDWTSYSHTGSYAVDMGGADTGRDYLTAPCDVIVRRIYGQYNAVWFESLSEVMCADGNTRKLIFMLLHINSDALREIGITVGKVFRQGEIFYREGDAGASGAHVHLEVGLRPFTGTGWQKTSLKDSQGNNVWKINLQLRPHDIFILDDSTVVLSDGGIRWIKEGENTDMLAKLTDENEALRDENDRLSEILQKIIALTDEI